MGGFARGAPGAWMTDETRKAHGWGAFGDEPYSFASVEMYLAALGWFYDQVHEIACVTAAMEGSLWNNNNNNNNKHSKHNNNNKHGNSNTPTT